MLFKKKKEEIIDDIDRLADCYFQCIYYLTETDFGDNQNINYAGELPNNIKIDKNDNMIVYSSIGTYNLNLISTEANGLINHVKIINDLTQKNEFDLEILNHTSFKSYLKSQSCATLCQNFL